MDRITVPWAPVMDNESPDLTQLRTGEQSSTLLVDVRFDDYPTFIYQALGYSNRSAPGTITRWPPARHPSYPWLRCVEFSQVQGRQFRGWANSSLGVQKGKYIPVAVYTWFRIMMVFRSVMYDAKEDHEVNGDESLRYVVTLPKTSGRFITRAGQQFQFEQPPAPSAAAFPQPVAQIVSETDFVWQWLQVPEASLFSNGRNSLLEELQSKVNGAEFRGHSAGKLLFLGWDAQPAIQPVQPVVLGQDPLGIPRAYDVNFYVKFFEKFHNYAPHPDGSGWYPIKATNSSPAKRVYEEGDFSAALFKSL